MLMFSTLNIMNKPSYFMLIAFVIILATFSTISLFSPPDLGDSAPTATALGANFPKILLLTTFPLAVFLVTETGVLLFDEEGLAAKDFLINDKWEIKIYLKNKECLSSQYKHKASS